MLLCVIAVTICSFSLLLLVLVLDRQCLWLLLFYSLCLLFVDVVVCCCLLLRVLLFDVVYCCLAACATVHKTCLWLLFVSGRLLLCVVCNV